MLQGLPFGASSSALPRGAVQLLRTLFRRLLASLKTDEQASAVFTSVARQPALQSTAAKIADFLGEEFMGDASNAGGDDDQRDGAGRGAEVGARAAAVVRVLRLGLAATIADFD